MLKGVTLFPSIMCFSSAFYRALHDRENWQLYSDIAETMMMIMLGLAAAMLGRPWRGIEPGETTNLFSDENVLRLDTMLLNRYVERNLLNEIEGLLSDSEEKITNETTFLEARDLLNNEVEEITTASQI